MKYTLSFLLMVSLLIGLTGCGLNYMEPYTDGTFETTQKLSSDENFIMAVYEDFTGSIEMNCEYVLQDDVYAE